MAEKAADGEETASRAERKERTRRAILDAALALAADSNLAAISLRQVAKQVGVVPTAFYRHFGSLELLGLALVDESFRSLRLMLLDVWRHAPEYRDFIDGSLPIVADHVRDNRSHYAFIARERVAGPPRVREAIDHEIALITRELATDIARSGAAEQYSQHRHRPAGRPDRLVRGHHGRAPRRGPRLRGPHPRPGPHPAADAAGRRPQLALARAGR